MVLLRLRMLIHSSLGLLPMVRLTKQVMMDMYRMMTWHENTRAVYDTWVQHNVHSESLPSIIMSQCQLIVWSGVPIFLYVYPFAFDNDIPQRSPHASISLYLTGCLLLARIFSINVHGFPLLPFPLLLLPLLLGGRGGGRERGERELASTTNRPSSRARGSGDSGGAFTLPPLPLDWFAEEGISTILML